MHMADGFPVKKQRRPFVNRGTSPIDDGNLLATLDKQVTRGNQDERQCKNATLKNTSMDSTSLQYWSCCSTNYTGRPI